CQMQIQFDFECSLSWIGLTCMLFCDFLSSAITKHNAFRFKMIHKRLDDESLFLHTDNLQNERQQLQSMCLHSRKQGSTSNQIW
ncbi:hypothetical protein PENTCL1PPCAC_9414, partial [Pristionchus entomophagus]